MTATVMDGWATAKEIRADLAARVERATIQLALLDARMELQTALGALEAATQTPLDK